MFVLKMLTHCKKLKTLISNFRCHSKKNDCYKIIDLYIFQISVFKIVKTCLISLCQFYRYYTVVIYHVYRFFTKKQMCGHKKVSLIYQHLTISFKFRAIFLKDMLLKITQSKVKRLLIDWRDYFLSSISLDIFKYRINSKTTI